MEGGFWRIAARFVSYTDLLITIIKLLLVILMTVTAAVLTSSAVNRGDVEREEIIHSIWLMWSIAGIFAISSAFHLWAVMKLISGTEQGKDHVQSLIQCGYWRTITFIILLVHSVSNLFQQKYTILGIDVGIRLFFLFIVSMFMRQLKKSINSQDPEPDPEPDNADAGSA